MRGARRSLKIIATCFGATQTQMQLAKALWQAIGTSLGNFQLETQESSLPPTKQSRILSIRLDMYLS
jgi:hypothetical protein